ncbi:MAG: isochorismatase family protein [Verrucomicrobiaceae bacterium]|nr:MAG: isochorismatase family protein [Verrucomicrobiaceae bacterium]
MPPLTVSLQSQSQDRWRLRGAFCMLRSQIEIFPSPPNAGEICVLYTAKDGYIRGYELIVVNDCVASESEPGNRAALEHMGHRLRARSLSSETFVGYMP